MRFLAFAFSITVASLARAAIRRRMRSRRTQEFSEFMSRSCANGGCHREIPGTERRFILTLEATCGSLPLDIWGRNLAHGEAFQHSFCKFMLIPQVCSSRAIVGGVDESALDPACQRR